MDQPSDSNSNNDGFRKATTVEASDGVLSVGKAVTKRYEILHRLGRGGMGDVWRAYDLKLRIDVALKSVRRSTPESVEALRREVCSAREVISPNVCRIFDLVVDEGQEYVSMEYIDGQTLLSLLLQKSPLDLHTVFEITWQFLAGLEAIHQAGLVHRDLKPENIMITRTGRVVVMDFGIAERISQNKRIPETISGTPAYMAPEQLKSGYVDSRSDVFAAGAVIAEMISTIRDDKSREAVWNAIRGDPIQLPDHPLQAILERAVSKNPENRFPSASALARALEEARLRTETIEERKPYPGLSAFTEQDTQYFFGRELEVETVLNKLQEMHLMAIIGPSGAGKTSFLRAGLIPKLPTGWCSVFTQPGDAPLVHLGQSLATEFSGDTEAIRKMVLMQDTDVALWLLHRWRQKHQEALLIVDRFEELFTLNDSETQTRFAELLGRAVLETNIRLLLAMRDDFLIFCKEHVSLSPIFSELTALLPLSGTALRTALIQPALRCGYRFEDEALINEILSPVEKERGALPLMAFAAARLWEKRDRKNGLLTRQDYQQIGGVTGALAQHAEATMDRIGTERHSIVREIFRNLITAQNTRAARDTEEILSIFEDRKSAEEVLRSLIDARLLNSFEAPAQEGEKRRRRVEIIHESLLSVWPRLVRWQTQDADSAQLRDQLHRAAEVWEERGRPQDLLWTGASYKEFEVWRDHYSGGLTAIERAFSDAMLHQTRNQRRRRRLFQTATFVILIVILLVIANFWSREKTARQEAVIQAQRAETSRLLALGRMELDQDPTVALAYAIASLETADTPVARRFAVEALWKGPQAFVMSDLPISPAACQFSPDGKWLVVGGMQGSRLLARNGSESIQLTTGYPKTGRPHLQLFSPKGDFLVWSSSHDPNIVQVWSLSQRKVSRTFTMEGYTNLMVRGSRLIMITDLTGKAAATPQWKQCRIRTWLFNNDEPRIIGDWTWKDFTDLYKNNPPEQWAFPKRRNFDISKDAKLLGYGRDRSVYIRSIEPSAHTSETLVGKHDHEITAVLFHPDGNHIASADVTGEIRIWSLSEISRNPIRVIGSKGSIWNLFFSASGSFFAASYTNATMYVWDMNGPKDAEPLTFRRRNVSNFIAFDPLDRWVASPFDNSIAIWPINRSYPYTINEKGDGAGVGGITPDGKLLVEVVGVEKPIIRIRNLNNLQADLRDLKMPVVWFNRLALDQIGKDIGIASHLGAYLISLDDGKTSRMPGTGAGFVSFSPDGRLVAAESYKQIPLWDPLTNKIRILTKNKNLGGITGLQFASNGNLFSAHEDGSVYQWDVEKETNRLVAKGNKPAWIKIPGKNPNLLICYWMNPAGDIQKLTSELTVIDLKTGKSYPITTHGNRVCTLDVDQSGTILATGDFDGILRIGPISGEEPHLIFGHKTVGAIAIQPNGQWIATSEALRPIVRLWRMPEGKPLHTLPYEDLLKKLRTLTNVRIVPDQKSTTGYRIQFDRFPGWQTVVNW